MKRLFLLVLLFAVPSWGITPGATASNSCANATTCTATITIPAGGTVAVTIGNSIIGTAATYATLTDTGGSTYTSQSTALNTPGSVRSTIAGVLSANSSTSVTVTFTLAHDITIHVEVFSGVAAFGAVATPTTGNSTGPSISLVTQDANNYVVAGISQLGLVTYTAGTGNLRTQQQVDFLRSHSSALNDNTAATATTVTNSPTASAASDWVVTAFELRSTTGAATPARRGIISIGG